MWLSYGCVLNGELDGLHNAVCVCDTFCMYIMTACVWRWGIPYVESQSQHQIASHLLNVMMMSCIHMAVPPHFLHVSVCVHTHTSHVQHAVLAGVHWRKWLCVYKTVFGASSFTISEDDSTGEVKLYRRHFALPRYSRFDLLCFSLFGSHKIYLVIAVISL